MLFTFAEITDMVVMTLILGYIFLRMINRGKQFDKDSFLFSCLTIAPAIILHELGHKFTAIFFGYTAIFHAAYFWLGLGLVLAIARSPFILFIPAYVQISCGTNCVQAPLATSLIALAGPLVNLLLYITAQIVLKTKKDMDKKTYAFWQITKQINLFLFIFNMLPIPRFDGSKVFTGLFKIIF